jgi:hypothetical protein
LQTFPVTFVFCISVLTEDTSHGNYDNVWSGVITRSSFLGRMIRYWAGAGSMQWIVDDTSPSVRGYLEDHIRIALDKKNRPKEYRTVLLCADPYL